MGNLCFYGIRFVAVALWVLAAIWQVPQQAKAPTLAAEVEPVRPSVSVVAVSVLTRPEPEFLTGLCPPVREKPRMRCEILEELHCRLDNPNYWRDKSEPDDYVTWCHEMQHGVNNRVGATTTKHGLYIGDGKGIVLTHPDVTIQQVASRVPAKERGKVFDLYMVKQRKDWNDSPIYILDETLAYYTGCVAHRQLGMGKKRSETFEFAKEMQRYSEILVDTVKKHDPDYKELPKLEGFVKWQGERLAALGEP